MDGVPHLPDDLIIWKILPLLPSSVLVRCKCVCKLWHKTISSDTNFAKTQLTFQKRGYINITSSILSFANSTEKFEIDLAHFLSDPHTIPMSSCNGLLVAASLSHNYIHDFTYIHIFVDKINGYYVINPILQRFVKLPRPLVSFRHCVIHFVDGLNKYKLVGWNATRNPLNGSPLFLLDLDDSIDESENSWCMLYPPTPLDGIQDQPVAFNGWLYWIAVQSENNEQQVILALNTKSMEFKEIEIPNCKRVGTSYPWDLRMIRTKESVYCRQYHYSCGGKLCYNIWTVEDYENQVWTLIYRYKVETCTHYEGSSSNSFDSAAPYDITEVLNNWSRPYYNVVHVNSFLWLDNKLG